MSTQPQKSWSEDMCKALEAGTNGQPCPNDFLACYIQGLGEVGPGHKLCFYVPGAMSIIDTASDEGISICFQQTLEQIRERYPEAVLIGFDLACKAVEKVQERKYNVGIPTEVTEEKWTYMLEVLPPMKWMGGKKGPDCVLRDVFAMSELECGRITAWYVRINDRYFRVYWYADTEKHLAWTTLIKACEEYMKAERERDLKQARDLCDKHGLYVIASSIS